MNSDFMIAVHAAVYLDHKGQTLSSEALAQNICTNPVQVRRVMCRLKRAGLVTTKEGACGGYALARSGDRISLKQILDALDERVLPDSWRSGDLNMDCAIASGMASVMGGVFDRLEDACGAKLDAISVSDIEKQLTAKGPKSRR